MAHCANLVSISDAHENKFVKSLVAANTPKGVALWSGVWMGGHDRVKVCTLDILCGDIGCGAQTFSCQGTTQII